MQTDFATINRDSMSLCASWYSTGLSYAQSSIPTLSHQEGELIPVTEGV